MRIPATRPGVAGRMASDRPAWQAFLLSSTLVRGLLRFPLFYKVLLANVAIVLVGVIAGTALTVDFVRANPERSILELVGILGVLGILLSALVTAVILRFALWPLEVLERTAERVGRGELDARVPVSPLADADLERLTEMFNKMLANFAVHQRRLQVVAARALRAEEEERKRIARELHDDTAQTLASLMIRLRVARDARDPEVRNRQLEEIRDEIAYAMESVRRFARALRPPALDEIGVVAAIAEYTRSLCDTTGLKIDVQADPIDGRLSPEAELALYRIVQESLSNVVRHADARTASVQITCCRELSVVAWVMDDGKGFVVEELADHPESGLGIFGMQERAAYAGGAVEIQSRPQEGTTVRVEIPIKVESDVV